MVVAWMVQPLQCTSLCKSRSCTLCYSRTAHRYLSHVQRFPGVIRTQYSLNSGRMRGWWATTRGHVISIRHGTLSVRTVAGEMRRLPWSAGNGDTYMASAVRANYCVPA